MKGNYFFPLETDLYQEVPYDIETRPSKKITYFVSIYRYCWIWYGNRYGIAYLGLQQDYYVIKIKGDFGHFCL